MATIPGYVTGVYRKTPAPERRSAEAGGLSQVAALVRRHDRDRFQTVLFAPVARREALFALYAFNYEIARVRESVTEPALGRIRLQWWRESIDAAFEAGPVRRHPVVEALTTVIRGYGLTRGHLDRLIEARESDLDADPWPSLEALEEYAEASSASLVQLALEILAAADPLAREAGRHVGIAYALAGLIRALPFRAGNGRPIIPAEIAERSGIDPYDHRAARAHPGLRKAVAGLAASASRHLEAARTLRGKFRRASLPALLPALIAQGWLARLELAEYDAFDPALAVRDPLQGWRLAVAALFNRF
jgi:NADH dehydrogenase [ubiquinone] 1 alpha subcomplex assembly factor 6